MRVGLKEAMGFLAILVRSMQRTNVTGVKLIRIIYYLYKSSTSLVCFQMWSSRSNEGVLGVAAISGMECIL